MTVDNKKHDSKEQDHKIDSKEKKKFVPKKYPKICGIKLIKE